MKWQALAREVWRDISTGTAWVMILTVLSALTVHGLLIVDLATITAINQQAAHYHSSLAAIHVITADQRIDAQSCVALNRLPTVRAAVAVRHAESEARALALPGTTVNTYEVVGPAATIFRGESAGNPADSGVIISEQIAQTLGVRPGQSITFDQGEALVRSVYAWNENDGRRPGYAYAMLVPVAPIGTFNECWVESWPQSEEVRHLALTAVLPGPEGEQVSVEQGAFNQTLGATFDGPRLFATRPTALAIPVLVGVGFVIGAASIWRRRLEIASDLHAGVRRSDETLKLLAETCVWVLASALIVLPVAAWFIVRNSAADAPALWSMVGVGMIAGCGAMLLGALCATLAVREKQLFSYFKNR